MSMLSTQCDELRITAESIGLAMPQAATLMMEAADTISRMDERRAKTFEVGKRWMAKAARFEAENAKLRELTLGLKWCSENYGCENSCPLYDKSEPEHCREERLLRELGMEVDE